MMSKRFRLLSCAALAISCGGVMMLLEFVLGRSPVEVGSLQGQELRLMCWQWGNEDAGWYSLKFPQQTFTRIVDEQGLETGDLRCRRLGSASGDLLVTLAFDAKKNKGSVRCWERSSGGKWKLSRDLPLPFKDALFADPDTAPDPHNEYAVGLSCSSGGTYAMVAWHKDDKIDLYRLDLKTGSLKRFAQLDDDGPGTVHWVQLIFECAEDGRVYVLDRRGGKTGQKTLTCYDRDGKQTALPFHDYVLTCLTGNFAVDQKSKGPDIDLTLTDLDHPERAPEHYHCDAIAMLNRIKPELFRRTGKCWPGSLLVSGDGQWLVAEIGVEDKIKNFLPVVIPPYTYHYHLVWKRHQTEPVYARYPLDVYSSAFLIGVAVD